MTGPDRMMARMTYDRAPVAGEARMWKYLGCFNRGDELYEVRYSLRHMQDDVSPEVEQEMRARVAEAVEGVKKPYTVFKAKGDHPGMPDQLAIVLIDRSCLWEMPIN